MLLPGAFEDYQSRTRTFELPRAASGCGGGAQFESCGLNSSLQRAQVRWARWRIRLWRPESPSGSPRQERSSRLAGRFFQPRETSLCACHEIPTPSASAEGAWGLVSPTLTSLIQPRGMQTTRDGHRTTRPPRTGSDSEIKVKNYPRNSPVVRTLRCRGPGSMFNPWSEN